MKLKFSEPYERDECCRVEVLDENNMHLGELWTSKDEDDGWCFDYCKKDDRGEVRRVRRLFEDDQESDLNLCKAQLIKEAQQWD